MAIAYSWPTTQEIHEIEQEVLPKLEDDRSSPFLSAFPDKPHDATTIRWVQQDNMTGVMNFRGYGGNPQRVTPVGASMFEAKPGAYGDFMTIEEQELTERARYAMFGVPVDVSDLTGRCLKQLLNRRIALKEKMISDFVMAGTYSIPDPQRPGETIFTDTWTPITFSASVPWATVATATPMSDIMAMKQLLFGKGSIVDSASTLYVNTNTANNVVKNRNASDISGLRLQYGQTVTNDLNGVNVILRGLGLPQIAIYDGFYLLDAGTRKGTATRFLADAKVLLLGRRPSGVPLGEFAITRNMQTGGQPQTYTKVIDKTPFQVPGVIEVHHGFNGGPLIEYPNSLVVGTVS